MRFKWTINTYLSVITLNVSGLNAPIKRHRVNWIEKQEPTICCPQEIHDAKGHTQIENERGWKDISCKYGKDKKVEVIIFVSDKIGRKERP